MHNNKKIKVLFLVRENQKWGTQSLYDEMELDDLFLPVVVVAPLKQLGRSINSDKISEMRENHDFFRNKKMRVMYGYDVSKESFIPFDAFEPDIVFYDQPYGLARCHRVESVSRYALTCYIPYGYGFYLARESGQLSPSFLPLIWRVFLEDRVVLSGWDNPLVEQYGNCVHVGYPKVDALRTLSSIHEDGKSSMSTQGDIKTVIYAPHHSLEPGHHDQYATFAWSGEKVLELAERTPQINWVFKPHPRLKYSLVKAGVMDVEAVGHYYSRWVSLPNSTVVDDGEYIDTFNQSSAMITDCGSFLLEYLFTGKPLLHLVNQESRGYSEFGEKLLKGFYRCHNQDELQKHV
ncbi:CDP-glycerol glycerophosphotransferase family protein [Halomonas sp. BM-2019]|uniref:CDP-glycerol glycerophosphotransferase family protein n=1 Tax=Halomonas sp. BM-2019 TaxID=2811227 RepID=UPI001B3C41CC|nr:MAG: CDP-glycerol glycerophosphotransferase family protein [Halomonas sp. BM-2019]